MGGSKHGWFIMENPIKTDDLEGHDYEYRDISKKKKKHIPSYSHIYILTFMGLGLKNSSFPWRHGNPQEFSGDVDSILLQTPSWAPRPAGQDSNAGSEGSNTDEPSVDVQSRGLVLGDFVWAL